MSSDNPILDPAAEMRRSAKAMRQHAVVIRAEGDTDQAEAMELIAVGNDSLASAIEAKDRRITDLEAEIARLRTVDTVIVTADGEDISTGDAQERWTALEAELYLLREIEAGARRAAFEGAAIAARRARGRS